MPRTFAPPPSAGRRPSRIFSSVDLPAPLGPSRPTAPAGNDTESPRSACTLPKFFSIPVTVTVSMGGGGYLRVRRFVRVGRPARVRRCRIASGPGIGAAAPRWVRDAAAGEPRGLLQARVLELLHVLHEVVEFVEPLLVVDELLLRRCVGRPGPRALRRVRDPHVPVLPDALLRLLVGRDGAAPVLRGPDALLVRLLALLLDGLARRLEPVLVAALRVLLDLRHLHLLAQALERGAVLVLLPVRLPHLDALRD